MQPADWSRWSVALAETGASPLCLALCNTLWWRNSKAPRENLRGFADVASWAATNGVFGSGDAQAAASIADVPPALAEAEFRRVVELREATARLFAGLSHGHPAPEADLDLVHASFREAVPHLSLELREGHWVPRLREGSEALAVPRWQAALSALGLAGSPLRDRVRQCADDRGCGWLFVDATRNGSRQFCQSRECGNRARQARFRERARLRAQGPHEAWRQQAP